MSDLMEDPVDLTALRDDDAARAARITGRVAQRVAEARLASGLSQQLARAAWPAALAAAASIAAVIVTTSDRPRPQAPPPGSGPVMRWLAQERSPGIVELLAELGGTP